MPLTTTFGAFIEQVLPVGGTASNSKIYIDNISFDKVSSFSYTPISDSGNLSSATIDVDNTYGTIKGYTASTTAAGLKAALTSNTGFTANVYQSDEATAVADGNVVILKNGDVVYKYTLSSGETYVPKLKKAGVQVFNVEDSTAYVADFDVTQYSGATKSYKFIVVEQSNSGKLAGVHICSINTTSGVKSTGSVSFATETNVFRLKMMLWNDFTNIIPAYDGKVNIVK